MNGAADEVRSQTARPLVISVAVAAAGAIVLAIGLAFAPRALAISYFVACMAAVAVVLGMLLLVMIAHLSDATWFVLLRRQAEAVVGALPALAILMLPLVAVVQGRGGAFIARAILYWVVWIGTGELLRWASWRQDADPACMPSHRLRAWSAAGLPLVGLTLTFAAFDWMMSLSPSWSSSVYGAYYFAGAMVSALALLAVLGRRTQLAHRQWSPGAEHFVALGRLTLAFVLFWGYLWYAQFFIIWIADIPREVTWYLVRMRGAWRIVGLTTLAAGFAVPFFVLLFRVAKRSPTVMGRLGMWLLAWHYVDVYWLLVPAVRPEWSIAGLCWDLGALAFVGGSATAVAIWRHAAAPAVPVGDPLLEWSAQYEAH